MNNVYMGLFLVLFNSFSCVLTQEVPIPTEQLLTRFDIWAALQLCALKNGSMAGSRVALKKKDRKRFQCSKCARSFTRRFSLNEHVNSNHSRTPILFGCSVCSRNFTRRTVLQSHIKGVHLKSHRYRCGSCDLSFGKKYNLERHLQSKRHQQKTSNLTITL